MEDLLRSRMLWTGGFVMYFGTNNETNYFTHADKKDGSMHSTTSDKGTDGKPNNSSAYNHEYYMKNKEKWGVKYSEQTDGDKDFDDANFTDENRLGNTDFYGIKGADGSWTIIEENMKWKLPAGVSRDDIIKAVGAVSAQDKASRMSAKDFERAVSSALENMPGKGGKTFDVDAAARDVIRGKYKNGAERKAALGDDYAVVQKRVNEMMKAKHSDEDGEVLEHHGIRGQKWGVRRFQNPDGTRTAAGKKREKENSSGDAQNDGKKFSVNKKAAAAVGAAVVGAALIAHPASRAVLAKYGATAISKIPNTVQVGTAVGKGAARLVNKTEGRAKKLGDAMVDAALASVGTIAISKLANKMNLDQGSTEAERNQKRVAFDTASAAIRTMTGGNNKGGGNNNGSNGGGNSRVDKNSPEYQNLFSGLDNKDDRQKIKDKANSGATMEELQALREELGHTDLSEWIHASEFGSLIL